MGVAVVGWLVVFGLLLGWQGAMLAHGPPWPTMSSMLRAFMRPLAGRVVLFGLWLLGRVAPVHPRLDVLPPAPEVNVLRDVVVPVASAYAVLAGVVQLRRGILLRGGRRRLRADGGQGSV